MKPVDDFTRYLARKRARYQVQEEAARAISSLLSNYGARVESRDRNVYVYFSGLPRVRYKIGPVKTWRETLVADVDALDISKKIWAPRKPYSTTWIATEMERTPKPGPEE